jgi:hypothetical protein
VVQQLEVVRLEVQQLDVVLPAAEFLLNAGHWLLAVEYEFVRTQQLELPFLFCLLSFWA